MCDVGGKNICGTNEECKAIDKTKNGHCECKTGFQRNSDNVCNELHVTSGRYPITFEFPILKKIFFKAFIKYIMVEMSIEFVS